MPRMSGADSGPPAGTQTESLLPYGRLPASRGGYSGLLAPIGGQAYSCGSAPDSHRSSPTREMQSPGSRATSGPHATAAGQESYGEGVLMSNTSTQGQYARWHGLALLGWAVAGALAVQIATSPLYLGTVLAISAATVFVLAEDRRKARIFTFLLLWSVSFAAVRVALAALTVHGDRYVLFTLPSFSVPKVLGGFSIGGPVDGLTVASAATQTLAVVALVALFAAFNSVASHRDIVESLPSSFFELAVAVAVALRFVPSLTEAIAESRLADRARTGGSTVKRRRPGRLAVSVLDSSLEKAVLLSESMDSRGFASPGTHHGNGLVGWLGSASLLALAGSLVALVAGSSGAAVVLLAAAGAFFVAALKVDSRYGPTKYASERLTPRDLQMVGIASLAPLGLWVAAVLHDPSLRWPRDGLLTWPTLSPLPLLATLTLLVPVFWKPPIRTRAPQGAVERRGFHSKQAPHRSPQSPPEHPPTLAQERSPCQGWGVSFRSVSFWFPDGRKALENVELDVPQGSNTVLVGSSGSGKSTLLRTVNGLVPHSTGGKFEGDVGIGPLSARRHRPRELAGVVGFVHQDPEAHFVFDDVQAEILFAMANLRVSPREARRRLQQVVERLGIEHLLDRDPSTLSGGEKQLCAIAAALAPQPAVLVADEPTAQLDPLGVETVFTGLEDLCREDGLTVLLAEHRLERAGRLADSVTVLEKGKIVASGRPREVVPSYDGAPDVTVLGIQMGWEPVPLAPDEARSFVSRRVLDSPESSSSASFRPGKRDAVTDLRKSSLSQAHESPSGPRATAYGCPPGEVLLACRGLSVSYGPISAIGDVDFQVAEGEVVALMGRNGSGKSTLLRALAGLIDADFVEFERKVSVAYVPQEPGTLLFADSVAAEVRATLELLGRAGSASIDEVDRWLGALELTHLADRHPKSLSGGERQRLAVAAVGVGGSRVLLLDEPTRGIDPPSRRALRCFVEEHSASGGAVVIATHDCELAATLAHRVVLLESGKVIDDGPPRSVLPGSPFEPQISKVLPGCLTLEEALCELTAAR